MLLERVIGNTVKAGGAFAVNPATGDFAFPAGCVLVFYNPRRNRQTHFFSCENNRPLTCVTFSGDGKYVCAAEAGRQPAILVWEVSNGKLVAELKGHAFSVKTVGFSSDGKMLASAGSQSDGRLHVWNWRTGMLVASARVKSEIRSLCFSGDGQMLMSAGMQGHFKYWELQPPSASGKCRILKGKNANMEGGPNTTGDFVDIAVSKCSSKAGCACYAVTSDGFLLGFDGDRNLEKWVDIKVASAHSLSVTDSRIACACSEGIVRLFHAASLEYISTLPRPPRFRNADPQAPQKGAGNQATPAAPAQADAASRASFPDAIAVQLTADNQRAGCIYSDRCLFVWDLRDASKVCRCRAMHAHSGSIWDLDFLPASAAQQAGFPADSFVTCSSDSTIRVWGLAPHAKPQETGDAHDNGKKPAPFRDLHAMAICAEGGAAGSQGQTGGGVRCLKVSPDGSRVASGDRMGNVRVHSLMGGSMRMETFLEAHDAEILSMDYGGEQGNLLASAARDRLIHVFDEARSYETVCTFDEHTAAVTSVRFAARGNRLLSCGGDKRLVFRTLVPAPPTPNKKGSQVPPAGSTLRANVSHTQSVPFGTVYDVCIDRTGRHALSAGQDTGLVVWDTATGSKKRRYNTEAGCTLRVRLDPTGMFAATTSSDKGVRIHDFHSGDIVCVAYGHSEPVTAVGFAPTLDRIVSASGDGCIFVWRLPAAVSRTMTSRQSELSMYSSLESVASTPREVTRVSGAGVFAMSPSPNKAKASKPTISDLLKVAEDSGDAATSVQRQRDEQMIASQRSLLSALLDETLSKKQEDSKHTDACKEEASLAGIVSPVHEPSVVLKNGNWVAQPVPGAELPKFAPAGGSRVLNEGDMVVSELEGRGVDASVSANAKELEHSTVASTVQTAVDMTTDDDDKELEGQDGGAALMDAQLEEIDKTLDFTVLTSEGVRMSRGLDLSGMFDISGRALNSSVRPGNVSGLGDMLESDLDDEDLDNSVLEVDESVTQQIPASEIIEEGDDEFLREALSQKTVVVDPRSSLRASRSVGHVLQQQICEALRNSSQNFSTADTDAPGSAPPAPFPSAGLAAKSSTAVPLLPSVRAPHVGSLLTQSASAETAALQPEVSVDTTPRGTIADVTTDSSILSPGTRAGRNNLAHEKNVALAREIDSMRHRLQAMGMCGGTCGAQAPTPALSAVHSVTTSVQASPAKPKSMPRNYNSTKGQLRLGRVEGNDTVGTALPRMTGSGAVASPDAAVSQPALAQQQVGQHSTQDPSEPENEHTQPRSLFDKMRMAGAVKVQQRADSGKASSGKAVYQALETAEPTLAEERQRLKEAAARKKTAAMQAAPEEQERVCQDKMQTKYEAEQIAERLKQVHGNGNAPGERVKGTTQESQSVDGEANMDSDVASLSLDVEEVGKAVENGVARGEVSRGQVSTEYSAHMTSQSVSSEQPPSIPDSSEPPSLPMSDVSAMSDRERENTDANKGTSMRAGVVDKNKISSLPKGKAPKPCQPTSANEDSRSGQAISPDMTNGAQASIGPRNAIEPMDGHRRTSNLLSQSPTPTKKHAGTGDEKKEMDGTRIDRRTQNLREVLEAAASKRAEVEEARRKAEKVDKALREALQLLSEQAENENPGSCASLPPASDGARASTETVLQLEQELHVAVERETAARVAASEAEERANIARQQAHHALQQVHSLQAGEVELVRRAQRETEARMTAEAAAVAALEQLQRLQGSMSGSGAGPLPCALACRGEGGVRNVWQSLPYGDMELGGMSSLAHQVEVDEQTARPRTAPPAALATHDLAKGVVEFAKELGHTVVSPVMSSIKNLQDLTIGTSAGSTAATNERKCSENSLACSVDASQQSPATCADAGGGKQQCESGEQLMCHQSSKHVMGSCGPEVFAVPSCAGAIEDASMQQDDSFVRDNTPMPRDEEGMPQAGSESTSSNTVPAAGEMNVLAEESVTEVDKMNSDNHAEPCEQGGGDVCEGSRVHQGHYEEHTQATGQDGENEKSLSCIQNRILPLDAQSLEGARAPDEGMRQSAGACPKHSKEGDLAPPDFQVSQHASIAETVEHQSRPSTAPTQNAPRNTLATRPATPGNGEVGWVGGRAGLAQDSASADVQQGELHGFVTPLVPGMMVPQAGSAMHESPSAGWQVAAPMSLKPARQADPNHPLRAGMSMPSLDETAASQSVYCSTLDDTQATVVTFGTAKTNTLPAFEAGERLRSSLTMALDLFNVARASGQRAAVADIVASLRGSQDRISEALRSYDYDLTTGTADASFAAAPRNAEGSLGGVEEDKQQLVTCVMANAPPEDMHTEITPSTGCVTDSNASAPFDASEPSPPLTARCLTVPPLQLSSRASPVALPAMRSEGGGKENDRLSHVTPAPSMIDNQSTALPSARSSMEYAGSQCNSNHCNFENLSEISIASEGRTVVDVEDVLERYSERLLQMVSAKLKASSAGTSVGYGASERAK